MRRLLNNINTTKPINLGTNRATGIELNAKYTPNNWFSVNGDINYNYFKRLDTLNATSFDFRASQWSSKLTTIYKLPASIDLELTGHYQSRYVTVQSEISDNLFLDMVLRKKILKGRGVFNLSIRDVFDSRFRESETNQSDFYLYSHRQSGRFITLGFSYGFGKGEAMEFCGQKMRH